MKRNFGAVLAALCFLQVLSSHALAQADKTQRESYFRDIVVEKGETVAKATCIFCSVTVRGTVQGEVVAVWGNITVEGKITEGAVVAGGSVIVRDNGVVEAEAVAAGGRVVRSGTGTVKGEISETPKIYLPGQPSFVFPGTLYFVGCNLLCSILFLVAGHTRVEGLAGAVRQRAILSFAVGAIAVAAVLWLLDWASDLQKYDDEVSMALIVVLALLAIPGLAGLSLAVGKRLLRSANVVMAILIGALLLTLLALIPLLGLAVFAAVWVLAVGVTLVGRFGFARAAAPASSNP